MCIHHDERTTHMAAYLLTALGTAAGFYVSFAPPSARHRARRARR